MRRHLGNGPPPGASEVRDTDGNVVALHGQQESGDYSSKYFDTNGVALVTVGQLGGGEVGIDIRNSAGRILQRVDNVNGQYAPFALIPLLPNGNNGISASSTGAFRPGTTSASVTELWRADFWSVGNQIEYDLEMYPNSGNMSWQIQVYEYQGGTPITVATGTETTIVQRQATFTIPTTCVTPDGTGVDDVAGRYLTVRVSALRNSGASTVDIAQNAPLFNHS